MLHDLLTWNKLTRGGTNVPPEFRVVRRPLEVGGTVFAVGATLPDIAFPAAIRRARMRQFYEQRRIEPAIAPPHTRQAHRVPVAATVTPAPKPTPSSAIPLMETPLTASAPSNRTPKGYQPAKSAQSRAARVR